LAHKAYPEAIWNLTPTQSGKLPVAAGRGGPFNIDWEVHGHGDIKLVVSYFDLNGLSVGKPLKCQIDHVTKQLQWIMGLGSHKVRLMNSSVQKLIME